MNEVEFCWDRIKHEEDLFTSRANFFLVGESMLLVGVATLLTTSRPPHNAIQVFCWVGLLSTVLWCVVNCLQRILSWQPARNRLKSMGEKGPATWKEDADNGLATSYARMRANTASKWYGWVRSHVLMGYFIPAALVIAWIVLLFDLPTTPPQNAEVVITFDRVLIVVLFLLISAVLYWLVRRLRIVEAQLASLESAATVKTGTPTGSSVDQKP